MSGTWNKGRGYTDSLYRYEDVYSEKIAKFLSTDKFNVVYAGNIGAMQNVDVVVPLGIITRSYVQNALKGIPNV